MGTILVALCMGLLVLVAGCVGLIITFTNFSLDSVEWLQGFITYGVFTIVGLTTIIFLIVITWERD